MLSRTAHGRPAAIFSSLRCICLTTRLGRELYQRGLEIEPDNAAGHTNFALLLLSQNDPETALAHLRRSLASCGDDPLVWNNIGAAQLRRGELNEAISTFRKALELDPCRFDARMNLIRTLSYTGYKENALLAGQISNCHLPEQSSRLNDERRPIK
jgi:Tfp pilus assembly protein PilF